MIRGQNGGKMSNKNGNSKINKWLKSRGYRMTHVASDMYSYVGGFHDGEIYFIEVYRTSLGYYIMYKSYGRPRYYLCETQDLKSRIRIRFSQNELIRAMEEGGFFPAKETEGPLE